MKKYTNDYTIESVDRALKILQLFSPVKNHFTLMEIANLTGLHKSTVMRMLYTLEANGFVKYDEGRREYSLGLSVFKLGNYARNSMDLRQTARPHLISLAQRTDLIVHLGVFEHDSILIIDKIYPNKDIVWPSFRSDVGGNMPAYCTGIGRLFLAYMPQQELEAFFERAELVQYTPNTITDPDEIVRRLEQARLHNVEYCNMEHEQYIYSISAPIFDHKGKMIAGISVGGFKETFTDEVKDEMAQLVKNTGRKVSEEFGFEGNY